MTSCIPSKVIRKFIGVVVAVLGVVHRLADAVETKEVHVGISPVHRISGHGWESQLPCEVDTRVLLKSGATQPVKAQACFVHPMGVEDMRPGEAGVLPSVDSGAAVARQGREGIDGI